MTQYWYNTKRDNIRYTDKPQFKTGYKPKDERVATNIH